jgi:hypothetical protein
MSKSIKQNKLRGLAALSLAIALLSFGCTTNQWPGTGEPISSAPSAGPVSPAVSATPGSSGGSIVPVPMSSVSNVPTTMISSAVSPSVDAIAVLRANELYQGKELGPLFPAPMASAGVSSQQVSGQFISPSLYANPQSTINTSISSTPGIAIVSGQTGEGSLVIPLADATTAAATIAPTGVNIVTANPATALAAPLMNTTATPVLGSTGVIDPRIAAGTVITNTNGRVTTAVRTTDVTAAAQATAVTTSGSVRAPVRIQSRSTGVTITNTVTVPATGGGRVRAVRP